MPADINVRFVNNSDDPIVLQLLENIYQQLVEEQIGNLVWITEEECSRLNAIEDKSFFVFGNFAGEAFNKLVSLGCRIYGAPCIIQCMKAGKALPRKPHPVYSLAMQEIVVTCTNILTDARKEIHQKIEWMMGEVSKVMNEKVNCLVAGEVGSKKYLVAGARKIKIMLPEWVHTVWQESIHEIAHGNDDKYEKFKCPLFKGLSVCASGLSAQERMKIKDSVEAEGGRFSGMMKVNECTHLVLMEPKGQKYQFAKEWSINTVMPEWVYDSLEAGYCLEESKYLLQGDAIKSNQTTSTPDHSAKECNISSISNLSSITTTHVNETNCSMRSEAFGGKFDVAATTSTNPNVCIFDGVDVRRPMVDGYLNGCKIYLYGPRLENLDKARILINKGGGMRFNQLNEAVSHVVAEVVNDKLIQQLDKLPNRPHVVSTHWLLECFKQGMCLPEDNFILIHDTNKNIQSMSPLVKELSKKPPATRARGNVVCNMDNDRTVLEDHADIDSLRHQYASASQQISNRNVGTPAMAAVRATEEPSRNESTFVDEHEDMDHDGIENEAIFAGLTFAVFDQEFSDELTKELEKYGGVVLPLNSRKIANVGVVPIEGCPVTRTVDEVVTSAWVNFCIEENKLVPYDYLEIFRPLTILPNCQPFKDCVLSISGVHALEKNIIVDIIQLLGGRVQDCFVRVRKENFLACTHLVANAVEGSKYEAALKWGIPIVSKSWVYECASSGKKASEKKHCLQQNGANKSVNQGASKVVAVENSKGTKRKPESPCKSDATLNKMPSQEVDRAATVGKFNLMAAKSNNAASLYPSLEFELQSNLLKGGITENNGASKGIKKINSDRVSLQPSRSPGNSRVKELADTGKKPGTPVGFVPGAPLKPCFNFQDTLSTLQSPAAATKSNNRLSLPLEEVFANNIKLALKNGFNPSNDEDDSFCQESSTVTMHHDRVLTPCLILFPTGIRQNSQVNYLQQETTRPLSGLILSAGKKLAKYHVEYNRLATELGAKYRWSYSDECTHFVFQGKQNDASREFRSAKSRGKFIVSPHWLKACHTQNKRIDEATFPHTFNENMTPVVAGAKTPSRTPKSSPRGNANSSLIRAAPQREFLTPPQLEQETDFANKGFINDLKKLTEFSRSSLKGKNQETAQTTDQPEPKKTTSGPKNVAEKEKSGTISSDGVPATTTDQGKPVQASQVEITWDYPGLSNQLDETIETGQLPNDGIPLEHEAAPSEQHSNSGLKSRNLRNKNKSYKFMFSGFKPQEREDLASLVESLGASVVEEMCTHLISNSPNRSEKFLACVSSGKWVLHKSYLSASIQAGYLIEEEDYEWGSEQILKNHPDFTAQELKLALSARSWRLKLLGGASKGGAFSSWKCLLLIDPKKVDGISRLLTTGGATIISKNNWESRGVTHAFIELKNVSAPVDYEKMVSLGIHCLKPEYISSYLADQSREELSKFYIPEITSALKSSERSSRPTRLNRSKKPI